MVTRFVAIMALAVIANMVICYSVYAERGSGRSPECSNQNQCEVKS